MFPLDEGLFHRDPFLSNQLIDLQTSGHTKKQGSTCSCRQRGPFQNMKWGNPVPFNHQQNTLLNMEHPEEETPLGPRIFLGFHVDV